MLTDMKFIDSELNVVPGTEPVELGNVGGLDSITHKLRGIKAWVIDNKIPATLIFLGVVFGVLWVVGRR